MAIRRLSVTGRAVPATVADALSRNAALLPREIAPGAYVLTATITMVTTFACWRSKGHSELGTPR